MDSDSVNDVEISCVESIIIFEFYVEFWNDKYIIV